jgi:hypothetical protein
MKVEPSLPKTLSKEENDGWAIVTGVKAKFMQRAGWQMVVLCKMFAT